MPRRSPGISPVMAARLDPFFRLQPAAEGRKVFLHGVASGDPLADRVILWTRVSGDSAGVPRPVGSRPRSKRSGRSFAAANVHHDAARDFTVKVDATGLQPGTTYYYRFTAAASSSPTGRTRTLSGRGAARRPPRGGLVLQSAGRLLQRLSRHRQPRRPRCRAAPRRLLLRVPERALR